MVDFEQANASWESIELTTQLTFTCSNLTIETLEKDTKYVHS